MKTSSTRNLTKAIVGTSLSASAIDDARESDLATESSDTNMKLENCIVAFVSVASHAFGALPH